jgi:hypothetical protein
MPPPWISAVVTALAAAGAPVPGPPGEAVPVGLAVPVLGVVEGFGGELLGWQPGPGNTQAVVGDALPVGDWVGAPPPLPFLPWPGQKNPLHVWVGVGFGFGFFFFGGDFGTWSHFCPPNSGDRNWSTGRLANFEFEKVFQILAGQ